MLRVALTGGIATGKSHVLQRFAALGIPTIDADRLAREVVEPPSDVFDQVVGRFGVDVMAPSGALDRARLAARIFEDAGARADLENIIHPAVYGRILAWFQQLEDQGTIRAAIADIPLLYETGHQADVDHVIVTICSRDEQIRRLQTRDGLTENEARQRINAQWPTAEKAARADHVIRTDGTIDETNRQVEELAKILAA